MSEQKELVLRGTISVITDVQKGTSKAGKEWEKLTFVITNNEGYEGSEQIFAFDVFGDKKVAKFLEHNQVGREVDVSYNIRTNEYNGKYFANLQSWMVKDSVQESVSENTQGEVVDDGLPF